MQYEINDEDLNRLEGYVRMGEVFRYFAWVKWIKDHPTIKDR